MKLIISNHKMNLTLEEVKDYLVGLDAIQSKNNLLVICPSALYLPYFKGKNYLLGSQNVASQPIGSLTGEISVEQLKSSGVSYVLIGHSERRRILKEELESIQKKVSLCLEHDLTPVLCVGETLEERNQKEEVLEKELASALPKGIEVGKVILAYEPIWSIGTGMTPTTEEIKDTVLWLKNYMMNHYSTKCKVIYGGSVSEENIQLLNQLEEIDGYLIGGASLKVDELKKIVEILEVRK